jgi:type III secretory pathway component EscV
LEIYALLSFGAGPVMKHLAMNSFSSWRALEESAFLMVFLRLIPRFPGVANFRMFSLLRLIFCFLAFTRHPNKEVEEASAGLVKKAFGAKAYNEKEEPTKVSQPIDVIVINNTKSVRNNPMAKRTLRNHYSALSTK